MTKVLGKLTCVAILLATYCLSAQTRGRITAKVTDQSGNPVVSARVAMVNAAAMGIRGILPECLTDDKGICSLDLVFGKYHVTAQKVADGYPDLTFRFYGHGSWPATAEITSEMPTAIVTVHLGPKAAILVLHTIDDASGSTIKHSTISLHPTANPDEVFSTSATGPVPTVLVPADEDVNVTVSADGYQPWHLDNHPELSSSATVHLHSQDRHEIEVRLKRQ
jgi:hypothetical protein